MKQIILSNYTKLYFLSKFIASSLRRSNVRLLVPLCALPLFDTRDKYVQRAFHLKIKSIDFIFWKLPNFITGIY